MLSLLWTAILSARGNVMTLNVKRFVHLYVNHYRAILNAFHLYSQVAKSNVLNQPVKLSVLKNLVPQITVPHVL